MMIKFGLQFILINVLKIVFIYCFIIKSIISLDLENNLYKTDSSIENNMLTKNYETIKEYKKITNRVGGKKSEEENCEISTVELKLKNGMESQKNINDIKFGTEDMIYQNDFIPKIIDTKTGRNGDKLNDEEKEKKDELKNYYSWFDKKKYIVENNEDLKEKQNKKLDNSKYIKNKQDIENVRHDVGLHSNKRTTPIKKVREREIDKVVREDYNSYNLKLVIKPKSEEKSLIIKRKDNKNIFHKKSPIKFRVNNDFKLNASKYYNEKPLESTNSELLQINLNNNLSNPVVDLKYSEIQEYNNSRLLDARFQNLMNHPAELHSYDIKNELDNSKPDRVVEKHDSQNSRTTKVKLKRYPSYQVSLQKMIDPGVYIHIASGFLFTNHFVITSAKAIREENFALYHHVAVMGAVAVKGKRRKLQRRNILNVTIHENYSDITYENDIAIVKIKPIYPNKFVSVPTFPKSYPETRIQCRVTGWGEPHYGLFTTEPSPLKEDTTKRPRDDHVKYKHFDDMVMLLNKEITILNGTFVLEQDCKSLHLHYAAIARTTVMSIFGGIKRTGLIYIEGKGTNASFCLSDIGKGSPLSCEDKIYGFVTANDYEVCQHTDCNYFTDIIYYMDWIKQQTKLMKRSSSGGYRNLITFNTIFSWLVTMILIKIFILNYV